MNHPNPNLGGERLRERTLANVLLDIRRAGPVVWGLEPGDREFWAQLSHEQRGTALDRLDDLQAEAREMIEQLTGVSWDQISEAGL